MIEMFVDILIFSLIEGLGIELMVNWSLQYLPISTDKNVKLVWG